MLSRLLLRLEFRLLLIADWLALEPLILVFSECFSLLLVKLVLFLVELELLLIVLLLSEVLPLAEPDSEVEPLVLVFSLVLLLSLFTSLLLLASLLASEVLFTSLLSDSVASVLEAALLISFACETEPTTWDLTSTVLSAAWTLVGVKANPAAPTPNTVVKAASPFK